jgi:hypothetical protein
VVAMLALCCPYAYAEFRWIEGLAGRFLLLDDLAPLIVTAFRAGAMRQLTLVTVRAIRQRLHGQVIVGAALRRSGLRMPPFWIRHENLA